ncbi:MAG: hypothetical protein ACKOBW_02505 [Planctomycetota bacterium]
MDHGRRRTKTKLLIGLLVPILLVWAAPLVIPHTALWNTLVDRAVEGRIRGQIRCGRVSLGWLSPVRLYDVQWLDTEGQPVAVVGSLASSRSLLGLALNRGDLGEFMITNPQARISLRADGSNLEDLLIPQPAAEPSTSAPPQITVKVVDGRVDIEDLTARQTWRADQLELHWSTSADANSTAQWRGTLARLLDAAAEVPAATAAIAVPNALSDHESRLGVGQFEGRISLRSGTTKNGAAAPLPSAEGSSLGTGELELHANSLPLGWATPLLRRWAGPLAVAGELSLDGKLHWSGDHQDVELKQFTTQNLAVHAPDYWGPEPLQLSHVQLVGQVQRQGDFCTLQGLELQTDVAQLQANGGFSLAALRGEAARHALLDLLQSEDYRLQGSLDLARLAQLAPQLLRVRSGTEITAGKLSWQLSSAADGDLRRWTGNLASSDLEAISDGRRVQWQQPIEMNFAAHQSATSPTSTNFILDRLQCQSTFLQAEAAGQLDQGRVVLQGDLGKLAEELDRFFDLQSLQLAGSLRGELNWQPAGQAGDGQQSLSARGDLRLSQLTVTLGPEQSLQEPDLTLQASTSGLLTGQGIERIETAQLQIQAGPDQLLVDLVEPVTQPASNQRWPITGRLAGDLNRWLSRARLLVSTAGWDVGGQGVITFAGTLAPDEVALKSAKADINDLQVVSDWLSLREPRVQLESDLRWQSNDRHLTANSFTFASSALAFRADQVDVAMSGSQPTARANVGFRTDLTRLSYWFQDPRQPWDWSLAGKATGQLKVDQQQGVINGRWSVDFEQLAYHQSVSGDTASPSSRPAAGGAGSKPNAAGAPPMKLVWLEPTLRLTGQGEFDPSRDRVQLSACDLICDALKLSAAGEVAGISKDSQVALQGEIAYDLAEVTRRLQGRLGEEFSLEGQEKRPFQLRGPLRQLSLTQIGGQPADSRVAGGTVVRDNTAGAVGKLVSAPESNAAGAVTNLPWPPRDLAAQASLGWSGAALFGIPVGPGQIEANLNQGVVSVKPIDVALSSGRLHLEPQLYLHEPRPVVTAQPGRILDQVRIAPEMCAGWLKYIMPIVADVAEADGKFSAELVKPAVIPLDDPTSGHLQGSLAVHSIQVGPGPLARELLRVAQLAKGIGEGRPASAVADAGAGPVWLQLPAQEVPFHLRERRVYHERLVVKLKDAELVTSGSVGLDNTLDLSAEIPIRDEWVSKNRYLASLQGQKLRLPISGTLQAPKVDQRVLQQLTSQTITNAAGKVIENELNRGLDRLIRPKGTTPAPGGNQPGTGAPGGNSGGSSGGTLPGNFPIPNIPLPPGIRPR